MESTSSPSCIIVACDATRDRNEHEIKLVIDHMRSKGIILSAGVRLLMLCILHKVSHPSKDKYSAYFVLIFSKIPLVYECIPSKHVILIGVSLIPLHFGCVASLFHFFHRQMLVVSLSVIEKNVRSRNLTFFIILFRCPNQNHCLSPS